MSAQSVRTSLVLGIFAMTSAVAWGTAAGRWSVVVTTAPGLPQDVWLTGQGDNESGWKGGGVICLGHLAQGFEVGEHVTLKTKVIEGGVIGEDGEPVPPGTYVAPSAELGDREFDVVAGETFYVIIHTVAVNSNVQGFDVGDENTLMLTFDTVLGNANQFVVAWLQTPAGFVPFLNEGIMKTVLHER